MLEEKPLSTGEVARLLHVSPVAVLHWIRGAKLKAYRVSGGHYRIPRVEFRKFLADNQIPVSFDSPPPRRILVVDDEAALCETFRIALEAKGYAAALATDGREALRLLRREHFDLIFLDIFLPAAGGISLLSAIRRQNPEAVVVLITGYSDRPQALPALRLGPAMLLTKPVKPPDIEAVLRVVFKSASARH